MEYLSVVLLIVLFSLLHDCDYFTKPLCVGLHGILTAYVLSAYGIFGILATIAILSIFWGYFRRGPQAKAELTGIRLATREAILKILKVYPKPIEYFPRLITKIVIRLPLKPWHRRIQSGLIALVCTGPVSALPAYLLTFLNLTS